MQNESFLLKSGTFVRKKYNKLLIAGILAWFVTLIDSCADTFLAGAFLNETAVAGIELVTPMVSVISFISYLISMGTSLMYSREAGAFHYDKAYKVVGQGLILSVGAAVILALSMLLLRQPIMNFYNPSDEVAAYANDYYFCQIFFALLYPTYYIICQLISIDGDEKVGTLACIASAVANILFSALLVKPLGIKGLALGSVIATFFALIVYSLHFFKKSNSIRIRFQFVPKEILEVFKLSSTTSMTLLYIAVIDIVMNKFIINNFTDAYLPAYAVINLILNLGAIFASAYDASAGFVSIAHGENNPQNIRKTMGIATRSTLIVSACMIIILELLAGKIPAFYGITSPDVAKASIFAARIIAIASPATALFYLYDSYYPTMEHVVMGNLFSAAYMFITPLVVAMPMGLLFGFNGMSVGFMLTSVIAVIVAVIYILIKYGKSRLPLLLEPTDETYLSYDIALTPENITSLCARVSEDLKAQDVEDSLSAEVQLILEESYMTILSMNPGKKVISECNILVSDKRLRMITRDNGKIFDITDADTSIKDLRSYVLARLMERNSERAHVTTVSFNRNSFMWERNTAENA